MCFRCLIILEGTRLDYFFCRFFFRLIFSFCVATISSEYFFTAGRRFKLVAIRKEGRKKRRKEKQIRKQRHKTRLQNYVIGKFYRFFMVRWESKEKFKNREENCRLEGEIQLRKIAEFISPSFKMGHKEAEIINYPLNFEMALASVLIFISSQKKSFNWLFRHWNTHEHAWDFPTGWKLCVKTYGTC